MIKLSVALACIPTIAAFAVAQPAMLIPVPDRVEHVYDPNQHILYISTTLGTVERFDLNSRTLLDPFVVPATSFRGLDISPDGAELYVADSLQGFDFGTVRRFDTATGSRSNIFYTQARGEGESSDVTSLMADTLLFTTERNGTGNTPVRRVNLSTGDIVPTNGRTSNGGEIKRDHSRRYAIIGDGFDFILWDAATGTGTFEIIRRGIRLSALSNRSQEVIATYDGFGGYELLNLNLEQVGFFENGSTGGLIFSPVADILFLADQTLDAIVAYHLATGTLLAQYDAGEDIRPADNNGTGYMSITDDGTTLFLSTPDGIRIFEGLVTSVTPPDDPGSTPTPATEARP